MVSYSLPRLDEILIERSSYNGITYVVYIPDAFLNDGPLPLLTLFRANPDEWFQSRQDESRGRRNVFHVVTDLIQKSWLEPCAFLFPSTCSENQSEFYFGDDVYSPQYLSTTAPYLTKNLFENGLLPELEQKYHIDTSRVSLDGFSLGGYTSLSYSFLSPGRYVSTGSFDGALLDFDYDNRRITVNTPSDLTFDTFPYIFGEDPEENFFRSRNPADILKLGGKVSKLHIMHTADLSLTSNRPRVENFLELLNSAGLENHVETALIGEHSSHQWYWVDEYLYRALPFHAHCLNSVS